MTRHFSIIEIFPFRQTAFAQKLPRQYQDLKKQDSPLEVRPGLLSLGVLSPGRIGLAEVNLQNRTPFEVVVDHMETSCSCVQITECPVRVPPNGMARMSVKFDPSDEPHFRGGLSVNCVGKGNDGTNLFLIRVTLDVRDSHGASRQPSTGNEKARE